MESPRDLVLYRLQRARRTLEDARLLANASRWNPCVNRLYYACFYAVSALLLQDDLSSSLDVTAGLELAQAALVYLSSCDSAQALPGCTDELLALVRVFLYAGSRWASPASRPWSRSRRYIPTTPIPTIGHRWCSWGPGTPM